MPLAGPAVVTPKRKPTVAKKLEPAAVTVRKVKPCNDNRSDPEPAQPAIAMTIGRKRRISDDPSLPMELPLSRKPVERDGDDYKRLKP